MGGEWWVGGWVGGWIGEKRSISFPSMCVSTHPPTHPPTLPPYLPGCDPACAGPWGFVGGGGERGGREGGGGRRRTSSSISSSSPSSSISSGWVGGRDQGGRTGYERAGLLFLLFGLWGGRVGGWVGGVNEVGGRNGCSYTQRERSRWVGGWVEGSVPWRVGRRGRSEHPGNLALFLLLLLPFSSSSLPPRPPPPLLLLLLLCCGERLHMRPAA